MRAIIWACYNRMDKFLYLENTIFTFLKCGFCYEVLTQVDEQSLMCSCGMDAVHVDDLAEAERLAG